MFDVQAHGSASGDLPEKTLASIAAYYRRVTTAARPMNRLIAAVMVATLAAVIVQIAKADDPAWIGWTSLGLTAFAIVLAAVHTVPAAVRLGTRADPAAVQSRL